MSEPVRIVEVTTAEGAVAELLWLAKAEAVHRQLRPKLAADYAAHLQRVFAGGGRMAVAVQGEAVLGVAVWRCYENTYNGVQMYVDDLVTDEAARSTGVGSTLVDWLIEKATAQGCAKLTLDSGTQRRDAHRFYLRERFHITAFHFEKALTSA